MRAPVLPVLDVSLGKHLIIECYDCDLDTLCSPERLEEIFLQAAHQSGATVIGSNFKMFEPQGVSGVVIIAESHFTVHTWPEYRYAAVDIFTCGCSIDFSRAMHVMKEGLVCQDLVIANRLDRGMLTEGKLDRAKPFNGPRSNAVTSWKSKFDREDGWGLLTSLDIHDCDPDIIRDGDAIRKFAIALCDHIEMKRFGDTVVVNFGEDEKVAGFSMVQLIETSLISGHFANLTNNAYIDIFSCKYYEPHDAAVFSIKYFKGKNYTMNVAVRK